MHKFLIADDHYIIRMGMKWLIDQLFPNAQSDLAADGEEAHQQISTNQYDLVILDINMPKSDGIYFLKLLLTQHPGLKVIIHTVASEDLYAMHYYKAGAMGYLPKNSQPEEVRKAIEQVLSGKKYFSKAILNDIVLSNLEVNDNPFHALSNREFEIATQLMKGLGLPEISSMLHLQKTTVATYKKRIFEKLNVRSVVDLLELSRSYNN